MSINEKDSRVEQVLATARAMMAAARTAPKACGIDRLEIVTFFAEELSALAREMRRYGEQTGLKFFLRDAANVESAGAVVMIATTYAPFNLNCGYCGFPTCAQKEEHASIPCVFNTSDMGTALGSVVAVAADSRIDNRIMYSVGQAALNLGLLGDCRAALGIALSCTGKSPFFDRQQ